ncbi:MAG: hypothetical protein H6841_10765 [Planctomycetes bacterium]|nr:hypothetical protein [Planctomycetota bacterium]MCB9936278.1 hypothetical protein [Planctomycetota bacterium]
MRPKLKPMLGLGGIAAAAAIAGIALLTLPTFHQAEDTAAALPAAALAPAEQQQPTPVQAEEPQPENNNVSPPAEDSAWPVTNGTVIDLLSGALLAREREDRAWLARTMASMAGKQQLAEDDLHAAHRQFLWRSIAPMWAHIAQAWQERSYKLLEDGDNAELVMQVGGAVGVARLKFVRIDGAWYFAAF